MSSIASGLLRNPNMNLHQEELKLGQAGCLAEPWGHNVRGEMWLTGPRPSWWWTGKTPLECPGVLKDGTITSLPLPCLLDGRFTRQSVLDYFDNTWTLTEVLFSALQTEEAFFRPPYHQLRHPMVFYYLHPAALYVNKFRLAGLLQEPINQIYEQLFETGVDEMSWDDMSKNCESWPMIRECTEYRRIVYRKVRAVLESHPKLSGNVPIQSTDDVYAVFLAFEHERIHIETSSVLMRELPVSLLRKPENWVPIHSSAPVESPPKPTAISDYPDNDFVPIAGEVVRLGRGQVVESFGWDNEFGETGMNVRDFSAQKFLCTNGQYWEFVSSGAYLEEENWTSEGWAWRIFRNVKWPTFWVPDGPQGLHQYKLRVLFDIIPMPWKWPVVVNLHEAKAYCIWLSRRLNKPCRIPTEAEHRAMRDVATRDPTTDPNRDAVLHYTGDDFLRAPVQAANLNLGASSEGAVDALPPAPTGIYDSMGNVWVWCEDFFCPLDGFRVNRLYDDFSTPCFDNKHNIIMGGSFISTGNLASIYARYHFRPHFFQQSGFRVVIGEGSSFSRPPTTDQRRCREFQGDSATALLLATQRAVGQAAHLHYGGLDPLAPAGTAFYAKRCAQLVADLCDRLNVPTTSALDLGCSVGGISFELAQVFSRVHAIDLDEQMIHFANTLKAEGKLPYDVVEEGRLTTQQWAVAPANRQNVTFQVTDATCLPPDLKAHDVVLLANLLDCSSSPKAILGRMGGLKGAVEVGGLLVNLSPYSWEDELTNEGAWLGGFVTDGKLVRTIDGMRAALGDAFQLVEEHAVPMALREHARKFTYLSCHATVWRRLH
eukprot:EG_transcript_1879